MRQLKRRILPAAVATAAVAAAIILLLQLSDNQATADQHDADGSSVRVAARALDDGRVEVAVQPRVGGDWSALLRPDARFLPSDVDTGKWLFSSAVALPADEPRTVCMVTHGRADDFFWSRLLNVARRLSAALNIDLRIEQHPDPTAQAAAVRDCAADGVAAIASTLAAPDIVAPALLEASQADVQIFTFNSGADHAGRADSIQHVALNELEAGRLAGQAFNDLGVSGIVVCVLHEEQNISLIERCDGLKERYAGTVDMLQLDESLTAAGRASAIAQRLTGEPVDGVFVLNADTAAAALQAINQTGSNARLGSVGINAPQLLRLEPELVTQYAFAISNGAARQALYTVASVYNRLGRRAVVQEELLPTAPPLVFIAPGLLLDVGALLQDEELRAGLQRDR